MRRTLKNILDYFIFGNFYIALIAVVMFAYTSAAFNLNLSKEFIPFVFFAAMASYSLHWYLTPNAEILSARALWSINHKMFLIIQFILSAAGVIIFFIPLMQFYAILIPIAAVTFLYSAPKINSAPFIWLRGKYMAKTLSLTLVWLGVTTILPLIAGGVEWSADELLFTVNRLMIVLPVCILFDVRDRAEDIAEGIINITTYMSERAASSIIITCCIISAAAGVGFAYYSNVFNGILLSVPTLLLAVSYKRSLHIKDAYLSDLWFYVYLDGLMALSSLLSLVITKL